MVPFAFTRADCVTVLRWYWAAVSAPVPVALVVSIVAVSIAPPPIAVSAVMPGLPVSVPAPPVVPASSAALRSPHATSAKAIAEPRIQDVRFMGNVLFHGGAARVTARVEWGYDSGLRPALHAPEGAC
jgi:hypothetical protein